MRKGTWALALPVILGLLAWAAGSGAVLRHVLLADDFVSAEIRRHGLVAELLATLAAFAVPYLTVGVVSAAFARGIVRLRSRSPEAPGAREAWIGTSLAAGYLIAAGLLALVERPANFAGIFWQRGDPFRSVHRFAEVVATPRGVLGFVVAATVLLAAAAAAGWWRHAATGGRRVSVAVAGLAVLAFGAASLGGWGGRPFDPSRPNVLVLVVDSLRPDRVDGPAAAKIAPNLHALSGRSVRFLDARTPCALTYPSMTSLMTGRHPVRHGVRSHYPERSAREREFSTLPRLLGGAGWATIAVGGYCSTVLGEINFGFETSRLPRNEVDLIVSAVALRGHPWLSSALRLPWLRARWPQVRPAVEGSHPDDLTDEAVAAWRRSRDPFFVTVFYDNPHLPYIPVWPFTLRTESYEGPNRYSLLSGNLEDQIRQRETTSAAHRDDAERSNAFHLYDGAVRSVDRAIGRLLRRLDEDGLSDRTVVVLLADHGENLLDAGGPLAHGEAMERDGSNHIPWWVSWPGRLEPREVSLPVQITDVAPTILDLLLAPPLEGADGISRAAEARGRGTAGERPALLETGMWFFARDTVDALDPSGRGLAYPDFHEGLLEMEPGRPPHVVIAAPYRDDVIRAKHPRLESGVWALSYLPTEDGARFRLFRRDRDPLLTTDLSDSEPDVFRRMIDRFYEEARRLGETELLPPRRDESAAPSPTISSPASEIRPPARLGSVSAKRTSMPVSPAGTKSTIRP